MRIGQTSIINFISQTATSILGFLVTVYLSRTLGDAILGKYFLVVAVLIWLKILGGQGIQMAVRKRISEGDDKAQYLSAGLTLQLVAVAILAVGVLVLRKQVNDYVRTEAALPLVVLLFTGLFLWQVRAALEGNHRVSISSLLRPLNRVARSSIQIVVVVIGFGAVWWLLWAYSAAELLTGIVGVSLLAFHPRLPSREHFMSLIEYAKYSWFSGIESRTFASMDTLVLGALAVTSGQIGVYEIAWNLASVLAVFGTSVSTTLFPAISQLSSSGDDSAINGLANDAIAYSGLFVIPGLIGCLTIGKRVLSIYGPEFTRGYTVLIVLVTARLLYVYQSQFTNVLAAIDRPERALRVNVVFVALNLILNVTLVATIGWVGAAIATASSAAIGLGLSYYFLRQHISIPIPIGELAKQAGAAVLMGLLVYGTSQYAGNGIAWTVILVSLGSISYFISLFTFSKRFRTTIRRNIPTFM